MRAHKTLHIDGVVPNIDRNRRMFDMFEKTPSRFMILDPSLSKTSEVVKLIVLRISESKSNQYNTT